MSALLALADRVEGATGADRELDCLIWCATAESHFEWHGGDMVMAVQGGFAARLDWKDLPHPTASLDAAMGLVPEGHTIQLSDWDHATLREKGPWQAIVLPLGARGAMQQFTFTNRCDHAATSALALTAAALRARAAMLGETQNG